MSARVRRGLVSLVAICVALAVSLSGLNAATAAPGSDTGSESPGAVPGADPRPLPKQKAGSAAGRDPVEGSNLNRDEPTSLREVFPLIPPQQPEQPSADQVTVPARQPEAKLPKGYDAATSREIPARRDAFAQVFANADGTETTAFAQSPVNYRRPDGSWAPIDTTLRQSSGSGWSVMTMPTAIRIGSEVTDDPVVSVALDANHEVGWAVAGAQSSQATVDRNRATFASFAPDADLWLDVVSGGVKETVVLRSKNAPRTYTFPLRLKGLTAELVGRDVVLRDETGADRATIPAGWMQDSAKATGRPADSDGVTYALVTVNGAPALRVTLDDAWLDDPARVYPVKVDPSVFDTGTFSSNHAVTVRPQGGEYGTQRLELGYKAGVASAAYLSFGKVSELLPYHRILQANLALFPFDGPTCAARQMYVHGVKTAWQQKPLSELKFPGPPVTPAVTGLGFAKGYIKVGQSASGCPPRWVTLPMNNAGRDLIQNWVNHHDQNYGLALRAANETDGWAWKGFLGTHTANPPKLFVTHTPYNARYNVHPLDNPATDAILQDRPGKIPVTVTNLGAEKWHPARYYMTYRVFNAAGQRITTQPEMQTLLPGEIERTASRTFKVNVQALPGSEAGTDYRIEFTMVDKVTGKVFSDQLVPPGVANVTVYNLQPRFTALWPLNGYQSPTLEPHLSANAVDDDRCDRCYLQVRDL